MLVWTPSNCLHACFMLREFINMIRRSKWPHEQFIIVTTRRQHLWIERPFQSTYFLLMPRISLHTFIRIWRWHANIRAENRFISTSTRYQEIILPRKTPDSIRMQLHLLHELRRSLIVDRKQTIRITNTKQVATWTPLDRLHFILIDLLLLLHGV